MPALNTALFSALQALMAQQAALDVTTNNIANANTPGYARQVPVFQEGAPVLDGSLYFGSGVNLTDVQSVRDQLLDLRIQQETTQQSNADTQLNALQEIEPLFTSNGQDIGPELTAFFSSISALSTTPTDSSLRQSVISAGQNLVNAFHTTASGLTQVQNGLDLQVASDVDQINQLTQQIASLNSQLASLKANGQDGGTLQDQQNQLILQLSKITDVHITQTDNGETLTTGNGIALVAAGQSLPLTVTLGSDGKQHIVAQGQDITSSLTGGSLGGELNMRDQVIPQIMGQLDSLTSDFATQFNQAQTSGYDAKGDPGQAFFTITSTGAASNIQLAFTDPALIAASSDQNAPGSNGNIANLLAVQDIPLSSGKSPVQSYASLVFAVGNYTSNAQAESDATAASLQQLNNQQGAVSGVSINEEATNMLRYQQGFEAAARVISTINQMITVALNLGNSQTF